MRNGDLLAHLPHLREGRRNSEARVAVLASLLAQFRERSLAAFAIAPVDQHRGAGLRELAGERAAETIRRAGDQDRAVGERGQVR